MVRQVQIHELWGWLLLGFSVLRCLTYFFVWLAPPKSVLPSRPPTEALGSFFLACGGLMFMFSTEEVTLAAMRKGRDGQLLYFSRDANLDRYFSNRYDDVFECRGCHYVLCVLLDTERRDIQWLAQGSENGGLILVGGLWRHGAWLIVHCSILYPLPFIPSIKHCIQLRVFLVLHICGGFLS